MRAGLQITVALEDCSPSRGAVEAQVADLRSAVDFEIEHAYGLLALLLVQELVIGAVVGQRMLNLVCQSLGLSGLLGARLGFPLLLLLKVEVCHSLLDVLLYSRRLLGAGV